MADKNKTPPEGVTVDPDTGHQKVNWKGAAPPDDGPYDPERDGYTSGGFPVGH